MNRIVAVLMLDGYTVQLCSPGEINILAHHGFRKKHAPTKKLRIMRMTNPVSQLGYW